MNLARGIRVEVVPGVMPRIAFTGAGGKTTAMFQLARQLSPPVWVTTSTHLGWDQLGLADRHLLYPALPTDMDSVRLPEAGVVVFTTNSQQDRAAGLSDRHLLDLKLAADQAGISLLVEADGSRTLPLKAPAAHEPVVPPWVDAVIVCAGLSGLGKPLDEVTVHRPEIFAQLGGIKPGTAISLDALKKVLTHPQGGLKGIPPGARRLVLLNQADTVRDQDGIHALAESLLGHYDAALVASLGAQVKNNCQVAAVYEPYAGIILAAGASKRLQRPKQLLDWRGEPLVRKVAKTALAAGCNPVIVVTGSSADEVEASLVNLPVQVVRNPDWQEGQASSIRKGVSSLPGQTGSAFFFLCDQPQVPPGLVRRLAAAHSHSLTGITAPRVGSQRANPVLFDRITFPQLLQLEGDTGGRSIFSSNAVEYVDWEDASILLDVDTPEDYLTLLDYE